MNSSLYRVFRDSAKAKEMNEDEGQSRQAPKRLITTKHLWDRASQRTGFRAIKQAIASLASKQLPQQDWHYRIAESGYVVGAGNVLKTVLACNMEPRGIRVE